jgi:hypothetical protein
MHGGKVSQLLHYEWDNNFLMSMRTANLLRSIAACDAMR